MKDRPDDDHFRFSVAGWVAAPHWFRAWFQRPGKDRPRADPLEIVSMQLLPRGAPTGETKVSDIPSNMERIIRFKSVSGYDGPLTIEGVNERATAAFDAADPTALRITPNEAGELGDYEIAVSGDRRQGDGVLTTSKVFVGKIVGPDAVVLEQVGEVLVPRGDPIPPDLPPSA